MRRPAPARILVSLLVLFVGVACSGSSGSRDEFCETLPRTGDLMGLLTDFSSADPQALEARFDEGLGKFRELERAAPREVRGDVAQVADAVERILEVVRDNPDDLAAIRTGLATLGPQLATAGKAAVAVGNYSRDECGIDLNSVDPTGTVATTTPAETTTTEG